MKKRLVEVFVFMMLIVATFPAVDSVKNSVINSTVSTTEINQNPIIIKKATSLKNNTSGPYEGRLRVYVVQPVSRWKDHARERFHYSLLAFPLNTHYRTTKYDEDISIDYLDTYSKTVNWSGFVSKNNVMVIVGVYDARSEIKNCYDNISFYAHYLDAAAGVRPGETAFNTVNQNFTHTVIVEWETDTKCPYCPVMERVLYNLSQSGANPFYYISMVSNRNRYALHHMFDPQEGYAQRVAPEAYFDGGYEMIVGGDPDMNNYTSKILNCGKRDVHQLNLSLSVVWKGFCRLGITVQIRNNEETHYPLKPATPRGPPDVVSFKKGTQYTFNSSTTDPDGDDVFYMFEYGSFWDGITYHSSWIGPYHSGEVVTTSLAWNKKDLYYLRVVAKDIHGEVGPRSEYTSVNVE
jgi:hypothetical protein